MSLEAWFWIAHAIAAPAWLLLLIAPLGSDRPVRIARWTAALLASFYLVLFLIGPRETLVLARDYGLEGVAAWFDVPRLMLLGWVHYLAFDLFVGSWEAEEARRLGIGRAALVPCLLMTLMLGPLGLLLFLAVRAFRNNSIAS